MATYRVKFSGTADVEADGRQHAIDLAWEQKGIHDHDITTIRKIG